MQLQIWRRECWLTAAEVQMNSGVLCSALTWPPLCLSSLIYKTDRLARWHPLWLAFVKCFDHSKSSFSTNYSSSVFVRGNEQAVQLLLGRIKRRRQREGWAQDRPYPGFRRVSGAQPAFCVICPRRELILNSGNAESLRATLVSQVFTIPALCKSARCKPTRTWMEQNERQWCRWASAPRSQTHHTTHHTTPHERRCLPPAPRRG